MSTPIPGNSKGHEQFCIKGYPQMPQIHSLTRPCTCPIPCPRPFLLTRHLRHAAASYGHVSVLEYLVSQGIFFRNGPLPIDNHLAPGGNPNIEDSDGDTPLYTVEDVETAEWLVQHGAVTDRVNSEGISVRFPFNTPVLFPFHLSDSLSRI